MFFLRKGKMTGDGLSPRNDKILIKQKHDPLKGAFFELVDFDQPDITPSINEKYTRKNSKSQSSEALSTTELISAASNIWDYAREPLSVLLSKFNTKCKDEVIQGGDNFQYSTEERIFGTSTSTDDQTCSDYLPSKTHSTKIAQAKLELLKLKRERSCSLPGCESYSFWTIHHARSTMIGESSLKNCLSGTGIPPNMRNIYEWMSEIALAKPKNHVNSDGIEYKMNRTVCIGTPPTNLSSCYARADATNTLDDLNMGISACTPEPSQTIDSSNTDVANFDLAASNTTCSTTNIVHAQHPEVIDSQILTSRYGEGSQYTNIVPSINDCESSVQEMEEDPLHNKKDQGVTFVKADSFGVEICLSTKEKPQYTLAKQEHAFAGAMAGVFVSLCLHPVDTVKTIIQSCRADQKPLLSIGRSIISERGVTGLYRGILSNIISSAPISAIYTYTYESVKKTLLPLFPKEYHSFAHCMAGGCASIATSFIFTPSERIKQQMQVGSHYRNSWNALIEVVQKGGLPSLYTGWGAVLCRNVPHSVIKFYTYESLKQIMLPSVQSNAPVNTLAMLVCGGLAGSMASLFTTPFDVVKTRLQTQIPGSIAQYNGVFSTLTEIGKREGLKGLYRGLTPRLVMYMIQGALFFASYESFKSFFSLEIPQISAQTIRPEPGTKDKSLTLPSPSQ